MMSMTFINGIILTLVTFLPAVGALVLAVFPRKVIGERWFALGVAGANFILSLHLLRFDVPSRFSALRQSAVRNTPASNANPNARMLNAMNN